MSFNHDKELSDFQAAIDIIRHHGFEPIAVTQMYFEQVFVFKTDSEAQMAYELLEVQLEEITGCWYEKEDFISEVEQYEKNGSMVKVFWLQ